MVCIWKQINKRNDYQNDNTRPNWKMLGDYRLSASDIPQQTGKKENRRSVPLTARWRSLLPKGGEPLRRDIT